MKSKSKHAKLMIGMVLIVVAMIGMAYASVPLYRIFCAATGFGGTTQRVTVEEAKSQNHPQDRYVTVTFDGNVNPGLLWDFAPDTHMVRLKLGQVTTISYHATNRSDKTLVGTASYNVQPDKAGPYFDKIQCFCFTQQVLKPGETVTLPVQFYVDEALANDAQNDDVQNITLSYTFFMAKDQSKALHVNVVHDSSSSATPLNP